ncbi:MAG: 5-bromo-4-chloroindolyl phosphate hydrolysis family protein [Campylobacterota bacterium]|nr:5-bromo-4-chloroindolyl phosphate hydrolysis family protein [Campylobacterota bacterium]
MSKAKRYTQKDRPQFSDTKGTLLYLFLVPLFLSLVLALFQTNIKAFLLNGVSFFLFLAVLTLAKKGFAQEQDYNQSTLAKAPKIPYKKVAGILLSVSTFFTALVTGQQDFWTSLFLAIVSLLGYYLWYGFDPKKDKLDNLGDVSAEYVLEALVEAKEKIAHVEEDMKTISDEKLHNKLAIAVQKAKAIVQTIQEDPKDVRVARKFLIVYIEGLAKVTDTYTQMEERDITVQTKEKLYGLMQDVEVRFDKELQRLKTNNHMDLDVQIDVLKEQIK